MPRATSSTDVIATIGIDIGKNTFHVIGLDDKGAIITALGDRAENGAPTG